MKIKPVHRRDAEDAEISQRIKSFLCAASASSAVNPLVRRFEMQSNIIKAFVFTLFLAGSISVCIHSSQARMAAFNYSPVIPKAWSDYVPTGFRGAGVKTRAVKGHLFGLALSAEDRRALIAFLKTL